MAERAFYESLPRKRMGAGCVFFNPAGEVLLLKPAYKEGWEIPGGVVEANESPRSCCEREVLEEMGLAIVVSRLLVVDYNSYPAESEKTESLMFIFDGGVLSEDELSAIQLKPDEILAWQFFPPASLPETMTLSLRNRILQAIQQKDHPGSAYLENQQSV